jgi:hypothetical protein
LYNGSTWSSGVSLITARTSLAGAGSTSSGLVAGGSNLISAEELTRSIQIIDSIQ